MHFFRPGNANVVAKLQPTGRCYRRKARFDKMKADDIMNMSGAHLRHPIFDHNWSNIINLLRYTLCEDDFAWAVKYH